MRGSLIMTPILAVALAACQSQEAAKAPAAPPSQTDAEKVVADAEAAYGRIETFVRNATEATHGVEPAAGAASWDDFAAALDDHVVGPVVLPVDGGHPRSEDDLRDIGGHGGHQLVHAGRDDFVEREDDAEHAVSVGGNLLQSP